MKYQKAFQYTASFMGTNTYKASYLKADLALKHQPHKQHNALGSFVVSSMCLTTKEDWQAYFQSKHNPKKTH